ncbi:MAG TPA: 30S ribosomal protein S16 [Patescibacteria group bacterium]|nr:30S ribosomal protein S16 [Patescibacteria group bacterium]
MLVIRLMRTGRKGESKYRVIVKEKRDKRDGKAVEILGWYTKTAKGADKKVDMDRVKYWTSVGAQMSPTVKTLLESK